MERKDIPEEELSWTKEPVIGLLIYMTNQHDSYGYEIKPMNYYMVAKHKPTGMIIIEPTDKTPMHEEFVNDILKNKKQFN